MDNRNGSDGTLDNAAICWGIAALAGVFVFAMLWFLADWSALQAIFGGIFACVVLGVVLMLTVGRPLPHLTDVKAAPTSAAAASRATPSGSSAVAAGAAASGGGAAGATAPAVTGTPAGEGAARAQAKTEAAQASTSAKPAAKGAGNASSSAASKPADSDAVTGKKPAGLSAARDGTADDLKRIKGIGPKLEKMLNSMGFWHLDQIAQWGADEVAWVDENLEGFKGRVTRDEWVSQAKTLAEGDETAFSKKVDKGDVY